MSGDPALERAVQRRFGTAARIDDVEIATLGGSNRTILFDLVEGTARRRLVSRQETYAAPDSPFLAPTDQYRAMAIAHRHGLPVPEPIFEYDAEDAMGAGFVTAFVTGETTPKRIQSAVAGEGGATLAAELGTLLARFQALPTDAFAFLADWPDSVDVLAAQQHRYEAYGQIRPALDYGLRWLDRHRPARDEQRPVHGDFRLGNFMVADGHVVALLDWECAHLGSAAEDLGWLSTRSWRFGRPELPVAGLADYPDLLDAHEAAGGRRPDREELRWWEIFGMVRWAILNLMQAEGHMRGNRRGPIYAACGRNVALVEYDLMMLLTGHYA